jgi:hypothetical protein
MDPLSRHQVSFPSSPVSLQSTFERALLLVRSVSALNAEIVSKLTALLERAVGVALDRGQSPFVFVGVVNTYTAVIGAGCLALASTLVLVSGMSSHGTEVLGDLRALGEGTVGVATRGVVGAAASGAGLKTVLIVS